MYFSKILALKSEAAALVKVTTRISSISKGVAFSPFPFLILPIKDEPRDY